MLAFAACAPVTSHTAARSGAAGHPVVPVTVTVPAGDSTDRVIAPPPDVFTGAAPPSAPTPELARPQPTGDGVWAVIVGINDYPGTDHDLRSARNDAADMDAVLASQGVPPERRLRLNDGQARADVIRQSLDWLVTHAGPHATVVFFYAGHVRKVHPGTEALVGADGRVVTDQEVADHLRGLQAERTWLVIAGCYGGGFTEALAPGRILTAAAPADQLAYESDSIHRSFLVEYMLHQAILQGHAGTSVEAAFAWATETLQREHPDRLPIQYDNLPGGFALRPLNPRAATPDPATSPRSTTPSTQPSKPPPPGNNNQGCFLTVGSTIHC